MGEFAYFEKLGKSVAVKLKCQEKNGHVRIIYQFKAVHILELF